MNMHVNTYTMDTEFNVNVALVTAGARPAYLFSDWALGPYNDEILTVKQLPPRGESIIFLKKNENIINEIIGKSAPHDPEFNIAMGKILGYRYVGEDWWYHKDRIFVRFTAGDIIIYSYAIPRGKFNELSPAIYGDRDAYSRILGNVIVEFYDTKMNLITG